MLNLELLKELVTFKKYGTLSETARHLSITQPSITRGMKKLESDLGVSLFDRQKNRITLNSTGMLAAHEAAELLQHADKATEIIINYDQSLKQIIISSVIPDPLMVLQHSDFSLPPAVRINHHLIATSRVVNDLQEFKETLIITSQDMNSDDIESMYLGKEKLFLQVSQSDPLAKKAKVTFHDLKGMNFIVVKSMGPWESFLQDHIPGIKFLSQNDLPSLVELTQFARLPMFQTNLTLMVKSGSYGPIYDTRTNVNPVILPITDPTNCIELYGTYLKSSRNMVQPLLKQFAQFIE